MQLFTPTSTVVSLLSAAVMATASWVPAAAASAPPAKTESVTASAVSIGRMSGSIGCRPSRKYFAFYVENNTTKPFEVYFSGRGGGVDEQGYDDSSWHGRSAYIRLVETFESPLRYGRSMTVRVKVILDGSETYRQTLRVSRPSRAACGHG